LLTATAGVAWGRGPETGSFYFKFSDTLLEPGETLTISVRCVLDPGIGGQAIWDTKGGQGQIGTVLGIGVTGSSISSGDVTGQWSNVKVNPELYWFDPPPTYTLTLAEPIIVGQTILYAGQKYYAETDNWLFDIKWKPDVYEHDVVTFSQPKLGVNVYLSVPGVPQFAVPDIWAALPALGEVTIVPTVPSFVVLVVGLVPFARRSSLRRVQDRSERPR
jgi:hypothetical protein